MTSFSARVPAFAGGTLIARRTGATGPSKPLIRANRARRHTVPVIIFFISLAGNLGGSRTPLGDPSFPERSQGRGLHLADR
jgi:hypothetical protein